MYIVLLIVLVLTPIISDTDLVNIWINSMKVILNDAFEKIMADTPFRYYGIFLLTCFLEPMPQKFSKIRPTLSSQNLILLLKKQSKSYKYVSDSDLKLKIFNDTQVFGLFLFSLVVFI